jgi:hypothetical protein
MCLLIRQSVDGNREKLVQAGALPALIASAPTAGPSLRVFISAALENFCKERTFHGELIVSALIC